MTEQQAPTLNDYEAASNLRILQMGYSGTGKTGGTALLAKAGYRLIFADLDMGLSGIKNSTILTPEERDNIVAPRAIRQRPDSGLPTVWPDFQKYVFKDWGYGLGSIYDWGLDTVFVIDTFTELCDQILDWVKVVKFGLPVSDTPKKNSGLDLRPMYGESQSIVLHLLGRLFVPEIKCHIIINTHLTRQTNEEGLPEYFPISVGRALDSHIGRKFDIVVQTKGILKSKTKEVERYLLTQPDSNIGIKVPPVKGLKKSYDIQKGEGLPDIFKHLLLASGNAQPPKPKEKANG